MAHLRTINQLTSYRSTPYQQLRDQLSDRQVPDHAYVEKVKIARQLDHRKSRLLLADDKAQREQTQRQLHHEGILAGIAARATQDTENPSALAKPTAEERKEIARHNNASKRHHKYRQLRLQKIENLHQ